MAITCPWLRQRTSTTTTNSVQTSQIRTRITRQVAPTLPRLAQSPKASQILDFWLRYLSQLQAWAKMRRKSSSLRTKPLSWSSSRDRLAQGPSPLSHRSYRNHWPRQLPWTWLVYHQGQVNTQALTEVCSSWARTPHLPSACLIRPNRHQSMTRIASTHQASRTNLYSLSRHSLNHSFNHCPSHSSCPRWNHQAR